MSETKLKGKGEIEFGSVSGRKTSVSRDRAREEGTLLNSAVQQSVIVESSVLKTDEGECEVWAEVVGEYKCT